MGFLPLIRRIRSSVNMTSHQPKTGAGMTKVRNLSVYSRNIFLLGISLIVCLWLFVLQHIDYEHTKRISEASIETQNLAIAFEEHVRRIVSEADADLLNLKLAFEQDGVNSPAFAAYAKAASKGLTRHLVAVYDEKGTITRSFMLNRVGAERGDREYFLQHRAKDSGALEIGKPIFGTVSGEHVIPLTRRINKPDGSFGGIVYTDIKMEYILSFYQKVNLGQDQVIQMSGLDGYNRFRQSNDAIQSGHDYRASMLWKNIQAGRENGTFVSNLVDGINRIISFRVMPDYPLVVVVGKSEKVSLAQLQARKQFYFLGTGLVSTLLFAFCFLLASRHEKQLSYQSRLIRMNKKMSTIFESICDPFVVLNKDWQFTYINKAAMQTEGVQLNESAIGQNIWEMFPDAVGGDLYLLLQEAMANQTSIHAEWKLAGKDYDMYIYPYAEGILAYFRDITEKKKYEAEIARLDRLNIVGEMAAGIGHEVRNPMTTVRGYLQLLQLKPDFNKYHEQFSMMIEELDRANSIITEFLSLAKDKTVVMKPGCLNRVVQSILPLIRADAFRRGHQMQVDVGELPETIFDEKEIRQLLLNLVRNAFESMPKSGVVTIRTCLQNDNIELEVQDTGTGIPLAVMQKLGTPFVTTKDNGTGLGLPVCYRIAQRHGAHIEVTTGAQGTTFTVVFPWRQVS